MTVDWPFVRGDAASTGSTTDSGPTEEPEVRWTHDVGSRVFGTPLVDEDRVYVATTAQLHHDADPVVAVDRETGEREWMGCPDAEEVRGTPALGDDVLVVGDLDGRVFALDPTNGDVLGSDESVTGAPGDGVGPILADSVAFLPAYGFTARTLPALENRWSRTDGHNYETPAAFVDGALVLATTRSTGEEYFVGVDGDYPEFVLGNEGYVGAFDAETGGEAWREPVVGRPRSLSVHDDAVVLGTDASEPAGRRITRVKTLTDDQEIPDADPVSYDEFGVVSVRDLDSGSLAWRTRLDDPVRSMAAVTVDVVCVGTSAGDLLALDRATGATRWRTRVNEDYQLWSSPTIAGDTVYVGSEDDAVVALDARDGQERWRFDTDARVSGNTSVVDGVCYVADDQGTLYALE